MNQPENKHVLSLLVKVYNGAVTDYFHFPEVIYVGNQKLDRADFELLLSEDLIVLSRYDSFGRYYKLSKKGDQVLHHYLARSTRKKAAPIPLTQGCLYFNRLQNRPANGARCLLFL